MTKLKSKTQIIATKCLKKKKEKEKKKPLVLLLPFHLDRGLNAKNRKINQITSKSRNWQQICNDISLYT